jgi:hypothetical protein
MSDDFEISVDVRGWDSHDQIKLLNTMRGEPGMGGYSTACTCDPGPDSRMHRAWCASMHQHPGPDCAGLCEPKAAER